MILISVYFVIIIYFLGLCNSNYVPSARYATSSVLVKDRLYFAGGLRPDSECLNDFLYLNLVWSFNTTNSPFENSAVVPERLCFSSSSLVEGGKKIYVFGGKSALIYSFDFNTQQWDIPNIDGTAPERREQFQIAFDNEKQYLYMFGGSTGNGTVWFNDMNILDTINSSWLNMKILGAEQIVIPPYWADYTATMLLTGEIVYIGGQQSTSSDGTSVTFSKMNEIYIFNTKSSSWNIVNSTGEVPDSRIGHTAVLTSKNKIIIYGGSSSKDRTTPAMPELVILNVDSKPYQWTTPSVSNSPPSRSFHSAAIIGDYMIIAFGNILNSGVTNSLNALDISDDTQFHWTDSYTSTTHAENVDDINKIPKNNSTELGQRAITQDKGFILGAIIGGILAGVVIIIVSVLLCKKYSVVRKEQSRQQIPSSQGF